MIRRSKRHHAFDGEKTVGRLDGVITGACRLCKEIRGRGTRGGIVVAQHVARARSEKRAYWRTLCAGELGRLGISRAGYDHLIPEGDPQVALCAVDNKSVGAGVGSRFKRGWP